MMKVLLNYNFNPDHLADQDFKALFSERRRDSTFAFVYETGTSLYAVRDHLGIVPLYYRQDGNDLRFSLDISPLVQPGAEVDPAGLRSFLAFGTTRLVSPIVGVHIVPGGSVVRFDKTSGQRQIVFQYQIKPRERSGWTAMKNLAAETDELLVQAVQRLVRHETAGLYLSGGIDSALIGIYLTRLGVKVNAYTSAPWGKSSSEIPYAKTNASVIKVRQHFIDYVESEDYAPAFQSIAQTYGGPHGTSTAIGVTGLWQNTPIAKERQIFLGQNTDTMTCSVPAQYLVYLSSFLPRFILKRYGLPCDDVLRNYLHLASRRTLSDHPSLALLAARSDLSTLQRLTVAGMYIAHTPSDGEVLAQPAIHRNILVSNPYYDMDLIEFCLSLPLRHRLSFSENSKAKVKLEKNIFRYVALKHLPRELVFRKKSFTISFERDRRTQSFMSSLPTCLMGIDLKDAESRFAAGVFALWGEQYGLRL
jgi:asparagine synthetase B (glutamine-hydrolysing)